MLSILVRIRCLLLEGRLKQLTFVDISTNVTSFDKLLMLAVLVISFTKPRDTYYFYIEANVTIM